MRSLKSRLFGFGVAAFFGTIVVVGCSASGDDGEFTATDTNEPDVGDSGGNKPITNTGDEGDDTTPSKDAGKKDASTKDASTKDASTKDASTKDASTAAPEPGDACTNVDKVVERTCGVCGKQQALCLANSNGSGGTVTQYGACTGEVANGCTPGDVEDIACGNCGTEHRTCSNKCQWTSTGCQNQPTNSCIPGSVDFTQADCSTSTYHTRSCQNTCQWTNFASTCNAPAAFITVPATVGVANSTLTVLSSANTIGRLGSGSCPVGTITTTLTPYAYVEVRNTNPKAVTVAIYNSQANGGTVIDTIIAAYDGKTLPADRKACKTKVGDTGTTALVGNASFGSLDAALSSSVTIPANSSVMVYTAAYGTSGTGPVMVNVKTESIAP